MTLIAVAFASLLSFGLPDGAEPYIASDTIYAEIEGVDVTAVFFDDAMAAQAIGEFQDALDAPKPARAGVVVRGIERGAFAGREMVDIRYAKPAMVARLGDDGEVKVEQGEEITRQVYLDLGDRHVVFTIWTKNPDADLTAVAARFLEGVQAGEGRADGALHFLIDGAPAADFAETAPDVLAAPVRVEIAPQ